MAKKKMKKTEKKQNSDNYKNVLSLRAFEMVQQIEYLGENWEENLQKRLKKHENKFTGWIYVLHDKDTIVVDGKEQPKAPHIHLYVKCKDSYKTTTLANIFGVKPNYIEEIHAKYWRGDKRCADMGVAYAYATHRNHPEKAQYDDSIVVAKEGYDWKAVRAESEERARKYATQEYINNILKRIANGTIKEYEIEKYVPELAYIKHKQKIENALQYYNMQRSKNHDRNIVVWYIHGQSGTGKSTIAKKIAEDEGMSFLLSGSDSDPFQEYKGQDAVILDDLKGNLKFSLSEFLRLTDNNTASSVHARYRDKFLDVKAIFITSTMPLEDFFKQFEGSYNEEVFQLQRRCKMRIELTKEAMKLYTFRISTRKYELLGEQENPAYKMFGEKEVDIPDEDLTRYCGLFGISYDPTKQKDETTQENLPTPAVQITEIKRKDDVDDGRGEETAEDTDFSDLPF